MIGQAALRGSRLGQHGRTRQRTRRGQHALALLSSSAALPAMCAARANAFFSPAQKKVASSAAALRPPTQGRRPGAGEPCPQREIGTRRIAATAALRARRAPPARAALVGGAVLAAAPCGVSGLLARGEPQARGRWAPAAAACTALVPGRLRGLAALGVLHLAACNQHPPFCLPAACAWPALDYGTGRALSHRRSTHPLPQVSVQHLLCPCPYNKM